MVSGLGERVEFTLDGLGNRTQRQVKDALSAVTWTRSAVFDSLGRMIAVVDQLEQTDHTRDAMGNLLDSTDPPIIPTLGPNPATLQRLPPGHPGHRRPQRCQQPDL